MSTGTSDPAGRTAAHYVHGDGAVVIVPARVAAWLVRHAQLDDLRTRVRGADAEVDQVLVALALADRRWRASATGSADDAAPEVPASSGPWLSTTEAGDLLGITDRAVRLAIREERIAAEQVGGRWRIRRTDVEHYRAARAA